MTVLGLSSSVSVTCTVSPASTPAAFRLLLRSGIIQQPPIADMVDRYVCLPIATTTGARVLPKTDLGSNGISNPVMVVLSSCRMVAVNVFEAMADHWTA